MSAATERPGAAPDEAAIGRKLCDQWREAEGFLRAAREEAEYHHDMYDTNAWTKDQAATLKADGRPDTQVNSTAKAIRNIVGRERQSRLRPKAKPLGRASVLKADAITRALSWQWGISESKYAVSDAWEMAAKGPIGWVSTAWDDGDLDRDPLLTEHLPAPEVYRDPHGRKEDLSDHRYLIRRRVVDLDLAKQLAPEKGEELERRARSASVLEAQGMAREQVSTDYGNREDGNWSSGSEGWLSDFDYQRRRVTLREHEWWEHETGEYLSMGGGRDFVLIDPENPPQNLGMLFAQADGPPVQRRRKCFYRAIMAGDLLLTYEKLPYKHGRFTLVPVWCEVDRKGKAYGLIAVIEPIQKALNVAQSRLDEAIRSRSLICDPSALDIPMDEAAKRLSRANFVLPVKPGRMADVRIESDKNDVSMWIQECERLQKLIDDLIGNNEAAYGDKSNEKSGVAIQQRVQQQSLNIAKFMDNRRRAVRALAKIMLSMMIQFWSPEKWRRVLEATSLDDYKAGVEAALRKGVPPPEPPDLAWIDTALAEPFSELDYEVDIEDQDDTDTEREATMQQRVDLINLAPPEARLPLVADAYRHSDFAGGEEMAGKLEALMAPPAPPPGMGMPGMPPGMPGMDPATQIGVPV